MIHYDTYFVHIDFYHPYTLSLNQRLEKCDRYLCNTAFSDIKIVCGISPKIMFLIGIYLRVQRHTFLESSIPLVKMLLTKKVIRYWNYRLFVVWDRPKSDILIRHGENIQFRAHVVFPLLLCSQRATQWVVTRPYTIKLIFRYNGNTSWRPVFWKSW